MPTGRAKAWTIRSIFPLSFRSRISLRRAYRGHLRVGSEVCLVYLRVAPEVLRQRLRARHGHYMTEPMLDSQLATLEEPQDALVIDADAAPAVIVAEILRKLE